MRVSAKLANPFQTVRLIEIVRSKWSGTGEGGQGPRYSCWESIPMPTAGEAHEPSSGLETHKEFNGETEVSSDEVIRGKESSAGAVHCSHEKSTDVEGVPGAGASDSGETDEVQKAKSRLNY